MKNRSFFFLFFLILFATGGLQAGRMALTFERLPAMKPHPYWTPREVSNLVLRALESEQIPAMGFVIEDRIQENPADYLVVQDWARKGHLLGNNTYAYVDFHALTVKDFLENVADGQRSLRRASRIEGFNFRFIRFPQLHQGETEKKREDIAEALENANYTIVPVTVKLSDYIFNRPYADNFTRPEQLEILKRLFLQHVEESLNYAEGQSDLIFGRQIPHIFQLRLGIATASFLKDLINMLKDRGYSFISVLEALEDPAYSTEENYAGPLGLTFLDRVAATQGLPFDENHGRFDADIIEKALSETEHSRRPK